MNTESPSIRILFVDDEPDLLETSKQFLERTEGFYVATATSAERALDMMRKRHFHVIVSDHQMSGMNGVQLLKDIRAMGSAVPFILFTGKGSEEVAMEALNAGADHYLKKGGDPISNFVELKDMIWRSYEKHQMGPTITEDEATLRKSAAMYRLLADNSTDVIGIVDTDGAYTYISPSVIDLRGYTPDEVLCQTMEEIVAETSIPIVQETIRGNLAKMRKGIVPPVMVLEIEQIRKDGSTVWVESVTNELFDPAGKHVGALVVCRNITKRKMMEEALRESEKRYRLLIDSASEAIAVIQDGRICLANPMTVSFAGLTEQELRAIPFPSLIHPDDRAMVIENHNKRLRGEPLPDRYQFRLMAAEGGLRWVEVNAVLISWEGRPATLNFLTNVTERMRVEEELRLSEAKHRSLFENMMSGSAVHEIICDENGVPNDYRFIDLNSSFEKMTGLKRDDVLGRTVRELFHGQVEDTWIERYGRVALTGVPDRFESFSEALGKYYDVSVYRNAPKQFTVVFNDVTERRRAEVALNEANKKLNLLSSITRHDITNQLIVLSGNLSLVDKKKLDESDEKHVRKAVTAAERISAMIQFTKEYERIGIKSAVWHDIRKLVDNEIGQFVHPNVKIVNDIPDGTDVLADQLIQKVFGNLMQNSVRHGGNISMIRFSLEEHDRVITIVYEDDGIGISADLKEHLFMQGYGRDHGLGLFLSREILAITNITISENGQPGQGVRFLIDVPSGNWRRR